MKKIKAAEVEYPRPPYGLVWIAGAQRPFVQYREIRRGKNKGSFEITLAGGRKHIVTANHVRRWPVTENVVENKWILQ